MDKIQTSCPFLPEGWIKEIVIRKSGASAGKSDVYYYSPDGKKCRSKPQMIQYLPDNFDLDSFDFRAGKDALKKQRKRRRDDFNFVKDLTLPGNHIKPSRQTKKARESIHINLLNSKDVEGEKNENVVVCEKKALSQNAIADIDVKKKRADNLSQRCTKPKQLFWQRRLQELKPCGEKTKRFCQMSQVDSLIKDLLPGSNNQAVLNSLYYSLYMSNKVVGQHASLNALRKHPTALCNIDQPFTAPFTITDEMLQAQEKRVEAARKKLTEAQELLGALAEEEEDLDDMDE